jgi:hypothetical protein
MADLTTNDQGEALYEWFPDWDEFQINIFSSDRHWVVPTSQWKMNQNVIEVTCTPSKWSERMTLEGTVYEAGKPAPGILVVASSFQGEQENHSDHLWTFTDLSGSFRFKLLPGSTYCAHIHDQASMGKFVEVPPVAKGQAHKPIELIADKGIPVEIRLTSGKDRKPIPYQTIFIRRSHIYSWKQDGETRHGAASHVWLIKTDENGIAHTQTLWGEFQASVETPTWRDHKNLNVADQNKIEITLHRDVEIARKITVRLSKPDDATSSLENAIIQAQPLDRKQFHLDTVLRTSQDGTATFEGFVDAVVFDAYSADGKLARLVSSKEFPDAVDIELLPATTIEGTLTDEEGHALADRPVRCKVTWVANEEDSAKIRIDRRGKTDAAGKFTIPGLPQGTTVEFYTDHLSKRDYLETFLRTTIEPGKEFEHKTYVIGSQPKPAAKPLAVRIASAIRDARQNNYRTLLILSGDENSQPFINEHLLDYDSNGNVARFLQVVVQPTNGQLPEADSLFLKEKGWTIPGESMVSILLLGEDGEKQSQLDVSIESAASSESVAQFLQSNLPPKYDFQETWQQALYTAKRENKAIWLRLGGRYCGPCFMLTRWIHEHKSTIENDFVLVKVDDSDDYGQAAKSLLKPEDGDGIPFHGIFNSEGELLLNSRYQNENIGFPSDKSGKAHMKTMLLRGRKTLSDEEIQKLIDTLPED